LFVFFVLAALSVLLPACTAWARGQKPKVTQAVFGGALLGLAIMTRPVALYLPVIFVCFLLFVACRNKQVISGLAIGSAFVLSAAILPAAWVYRNTVVFSVPNLTTVDAVNKVYFMGAGAYQLRYGLTLEDAQQRISQEFGLPHYAMTQNPWLTDRSVAELDAELRAVSFRVVTKYPGELVESSALAVVKSSVSHNMGE